MMEQKATTIQLKDPGPHEGTLFVIVDYDARTISLVEIAAKEAEYSGNRIRVLEVQTYTQAGA